MEVNKASTPGRLRVVVVVGGAAAAAVVGGAREDERVREAITCLYVWIGVGGVLGSL